METIHGQIRRQSQGKGMFFSVLLGSNKNKIKAFEFLDEIAAGGSTNIENALMDAISLASESDSDRIPIILFLTDGGPSVDGKDIQSVVQTISESASSSISINGISLGTNDLTGWQLVQRLTQKNRGLSSKVFNIFIMSLD